jgi:hypothetical protein
MLAIPTTVTMIGAGFVPAFRRVQQSGDFDCSFAVIAMICSTTLEAVRNVAIERFQHPAHGPYWITCDFIARLLAHCGYDTGMYEEPASVSEIPNLAIALVDYDDHTNLGRHVLFHRARASHDSGIKVEYVIDPAYWIEPQDYVRTRLPTIQWYLGVCVMTEGLTKVPSPTYRRILPRCRAPVRRQAQPSSLPALLRCDRCCRSRCCALNEISGVWNAEDNPGLWIPTIKQTVLQAVWPLVVRVRPASDSHVENPPVRVCRPVLKHWFISVSPVMRSWRSWMSSTTASGVVTVTGQAGRVM